MSIILNNPLQPQLKWGKFIMFNIDFKCNRTDACSFCYNKLMDIEQQATTATVINEVANQAEENRAKFILISGGEPLSSDMLFPTLDVMKPKPMETIVATNGDLICRDMLQEIASRGCTHLAISIPQRRDIKEFLDRLRILEYEDFTVGISAVHTKENDGYFMTLVDILAQFSCVSAITKQNVCPHPLFDSVLPTVAQSNKIAVDMFKLQKVYKNITFRLARRPLDNIALKQYIPNLPGPDCGNDWSGGYARILPNGDITNCVTYGKCLGNIMTHNLKEMGNYPEELRKSIIKSCPYYEHIKDNYAESMAKRS